MSTASTIVFFAIVLAVVVLSPGFEAVRESFFNPTDMRQAFFGVPSEGLPSIWTAFLLNVKIFLVAEVLRSSSWAYSSPSFEWSRGRPSSPFRLVAIVYTDVLRGTPILLVIYILGFGVPALGIPGLSSQSVIVYGTVALVLSYSAYVSEVYRAGIASVHTSQMAAARSLGLSRWQSLRWVVLPQAIRRVIPPLLNDFIGPAEGHRAVWRSSASSRRSRAAQISAS